MTFQQSSTAPAGFNNSVVATTTVADTSLAAGQRAIFLQRIEGFNIADLGWGTANAKTVTLSFWVRSSLTGTFGGAFTDTTRAYPFTYTISSANTWEQKSITISGDTSGSWNSTNGWGVQVAFGLGVGSTFNGTAGAWVNGDLNSTTGAVSVIGTLNATWYITGVQLEKGSAATAFEYRQFGTELNLCQRYYYKQVGSTLYPFFSTGFINTSTRMFGIFNFPQMMRAIPTLETTGTPSNYMILSSPASPSCTGITLDGQTTNFSAFLIIDASGGGLTAGQGSIFRGNNTASAFIAYSAEL
jgi:hypothetical protein